MLQVVSPIRIVRKILGEQKTAGGTPYRLTTHCLRVEQPEGVLLYHTLTGELLLLDREAAASLGKLPGPVPPALTELVPRWFLRPEGSDDMALADQVRQIAQRFGSKEAALTSYKIFTTTDCNARCFYCYEAGIEKAFMTELTALDTAAYIAAHRGGKPVRIHWFGGEPLVNVRAIDVITDYLRRQGVAFRSAMTTNGYLIDEALAARMKDDWKLSEVQITLDGTEAVYNQRKAYVHPQGSPYLRVLGNIGLLLDAGVPVKVRMNLDGDNERDLYALVDQLAERFWGKPDFGVYPMVVLENAGTAPVSYTEPERRANAQKLWSLQLYIERMGLAARSPLERAVTVNGCEADNDGFTVVSPEGRLSRCEARVNDAVWGSIYTDETDEEVLCKWRERKQPEAICQTCVAYPKCLRVKKCPMWLEHCSPIEQAYRVERLRRAALGAYEDWKAAGQR